jgi:group II intron reverse transcriptase/maturase
LKPTSEILVRIEKSSTNHPDGVFTRLYRYLLREDIYFAAYQKLYANKGATTKGISNDTADGFSNRYVQNLIQSLKDGTYKASPTRREYIPKQNGKLRPLGIPSFQDKLLQEAVRMILEAIYEPVFDSNSHGFRPGRSCHTALRQISYDFTGVVWFIEGDIQGCFDNINHEVLLEILGRKIKDSRFLNIIRQFLKAGYIENWQYNATYSGTPQGGICSPILANIYLNELDRKFREIASRFNKPRSTPKTEAYRSLDNEMKRLSSRIKNEKDAVIRMEMIHRYQALRKSLHLIPARPADNKKFTFVRYADDWLVGVCGTKQDCLELKADIAEFLKSELKLTLSEEKTLITHSSKNVRFLGYDICVRRSQEVKGHRMSNGTWRQSRSLYMKVALTVPHREKIESFLFAKGVIRQKPNGEFIPIHRAGLLNLSDSEIVEHYNAEARGLCNYYNLACDYHTLDYFCYLMEYSCLKTIANKHKSSVRKIIRLYKDGKTWSVPHETKYGTKRVRPVKIADCKRGKATDIIYKRRKYNWKSTIRQRLNAGKCELCGKKELNLLEVHVVRNLNELGNAEWEIAMKARRRKTLVICSECHSKIHNR